MCSPDSILNLLLNNLEIVSFITEKGVLDVSLLFHVLVCVGAVFILYFIALYCTMLYFTSAKCIRLFMMLQ